MHAYTDVHAYGLAFTYCTCLQHVGIDTYICGYIRRAVAATGPAAISGCMHGPSRALRKPGGEATTTWTVARSQLPCPRQLASFCACSHKRLHHLSKCTLMCCYQLATCCQQQLKSDCFLEPSRSARQHNLSTCLALQLPGAKQQIQHHISQNHSDTLGCDQHLLNTTLQHTSKLHAQPLASTAKVWSLETLINARLWPTAIASNRSEILASIPKSRLQIAAWKHPYSTHWWIDFRLFCDSVNCFPSDLNFWILPCEWETFHTGRASILLGETMLNAPLVTAENQLANPLFSFRHVLRTSATFKWFSFWIHCVTSA